MARNFNGTTNTAINNGGPSVGSPITISAWFNTTNLSQVNPRFVSYGNDAASRGYCIGISNVGNTGWADDHSGGSDTLTYTTNTFTSGTWNHMVGIFDATVLGYLNADFAHGSSQSQTAPFTRQGICIGASNFNNTAGSFYAGSVAEVGLWSVDLTQAEILALFRGARCYQIRPKSLFLYFPLDGLASPEPDLSGNATNVTLSGTTAVRIGPPLMPFTPRWQQFIPPPPTFVLMPQACL